MERTSKNNLLLGIIIVLVILVSATGGAIADRLFVIKPLDYILEEGRNAGLPIGEVNTTVLHEENVVIDVAEKVSPSVVTVTVQTPRRRILEFNPFGRGFEQRYEGGTDQDIGTGFVVDANGVIITNKHVVSDTGVSYKVVTKDGNEYDVKEISRDPSNDLAVLKIDASGLTPVQLGDSSNLKAGQFVIAIGTALGEFRHTVTTGVISGLGRGIVAGSAYEGYVERLDDVIQTDAAINPGNSGGPLLNSAGQVIGVNVAVAQGAQNIGFAIPVNIVKDALSQYTETGNFASKPFLGVEYQMITQQSALLNEVPQGAYIQNIVEGSPAERAGLEVEDIIVKIDGVEIKDQEDGLAGVIAEKKAGQKVTLEVWRNGDTRNIEVTLSESSQ